MTVDKQALLRGRVFERIAVRALELDETLASGNQFHDRSDGKGRIRLSAKSTSQRSWAQTRQQLREALDMAQGTGEVAVLAIEDDDGEQLLLMRLCDGAALLTDEARPERVPRRSDVIREVSTLPVLLRDDMG